MKTLVGKPIITSNRSVVRFARPKIKSTYKGENSLRNFGSIIWNLLIPRDLKSCSTLEEFKHSIKSWKPIHCPCRLCKDFLPSLGFFSTRRD